MFSVFFYLVSYLVLLVAQSSIPVRSIPVVRGLFLVLLLVQTVFATLLSLKVHAPLLGTTLGLLTFFPCFGLLPVLFIYMKATTVLRHGDLKFDIREAPRTDFPEF